MPQPLSKALETFRRRALYTKKINQLANCLYTCFLTEHPFSTDLIYLQFTVRLKSGPVGQFWLGRGLDMSDPQYKPYVVMMVTHGLGLPFCAKNA